MDLTGSVVIAEATEKLRKVQIRPPFQVDCEEVSGVKVTPKGRLLEGPALGLTSLGVIKFWTAASSVSLGLRQKALSWSLVLGDFSAGDRDQEHCVLTSRISTRLPALPNRGSLFCCARVLPSNVATDSLQFQEYSSTQGPPPPTPGGQRGGVRSVGLSQDNASCSWGVCGRLSEWSPQEGQHSSYRF